MDDDQLFALNKTPTPPWKIFLACLKAENPFQALGSLRSSLISQGCSQHYVYDIFSSFLAHCIETGLDNEEKEGMTSADYVREILDGVVGWCGKQSWSFPDRPYYNPRPAIGMTRDEIKKEFNGDPDETGCKNVIWVYGLQEYYFDKSDRLDCIYHRGEKEGSWHPVGKTIEEFAKMECEEKTAQEKDHPCPSQKPLEE